jgi:hypothetical protein
MHRVWQSLLLLPGIAIRSDTGQSKKPKVGREWPAWKWIGAQTEDIVRRFCGYGAVHSDIGFISVTWVQKWSP